MNAIVPVHSQPTYVAPGAPAPPQPTTQPYNSDSLDKVQQATPQRRGIDVTV
jgi:hypothetical protein